MEYMKQMEQYAQLTAQEERELGRRIQAGDRKAKEILINSNLKLVASMAKQYNLARILEFDDFFQAGCEGLIRAAEKYDPEKGFRFSTYASWWIKQSLNRVYYNEDRTIRMPIHTCEKLAKLSKTIAKMRSEYGFEPSKEELAAELGWTMNEVEFIVDKVIPAASTASLEYPVGEKNETFLHEILPDEHTPNPERAAEETSMKEELQAILYDVLNDNERHVVGLRFGFGDRGIFTLEETGREMGISKERVRQIESNAIKKLKMSKYRQILFGYFAS